MVYSKMNSKHVPTYQFVSSNQHGDRYREQDGKTNYHTGRMTAAFDDAKELIQLVLIAQMLRIIVEYNFNEHVAYIDIAAVVPY
ncbi:MAG: hypothetical protein GQ565_02990 [Candidatus Aegiribacteria sp.]|nr:hypothetical protein [Candidatus Aegiribacteria sp.]